MTLRRSTSPVWTSNRAGRAGVLTVLALAAALAVVTSCAPRDEGPIERRVMIIGLDGLELDVMGPLLEEGRLPNFARLMHEGSWGEIQSLDVLESPVIWTSIATGMTPDKHGVTGFLKPSADGAAGTPTPQNARRVAAVWDILGSRGKTVGVVGWLVTWPAEPVNGYLVTCNFNYGWDEGAAGDQRVTFPEELRTEILDARVLPADVTEEDLGRFVRASALGSRTPPRIETLKACIANDETTRGVGLRLGRERPTDFFAVYLRGVDGPCHAFWTDLFRDSGPPVPEWEARAFHEVIPLYYEYVDRVLGEFLALADENTTAIVTSDHGHSGPKPKDGGGYEFGIPMHDSTGVVILWGKDIEKGRELTDVSVLDITPTVLALFGLPVGEDMDGRVLAEAMSPRFMKAHPVSSIPTYETQVRREVSAEPIESPVDDEIRERMRALGYIE